MDYHMAEMSKIIEELLPDSLPSNTKANNPNESLKAITLRSGKEIPSHTETDPKIELVEP